MRREWTAMCRHWGQRVRSLERARTDSENFLRQRHRDAESRHQARITELTDQVAQLQAQLRDSEAARQAAERRAEERVLDVNALVDFLMGNKPKINVMFNWVRLSALLHHFAEGTPIPEGWLTNINVVALDDPRCECPEYVKPSPRPDNGDSSSGGRQAKREPTPPWYPLGRCYLKVQKRKQSTQETEALQAKLPASSDDEAAADNDKSGEKSDEAETKSKPAASHPSPAGLRESKTQKKGDTGSSSKAGLRESKTQKKGDKGSNSKNPEIPSDGLRRIRSKLVKLTYDDLRGEHLDMVEAACRETHVSYRIYGILVKFDSYKQSQGYPDFEPHKTDIHILKARWDSEAYQACLCVACKHSRLYGLA
ncbi:hypothetical protein PHMEG_00030708 [Phytophthora megakarya]|uniref:Uncharacterized protein n=1 Tax=Phytophthora megakarya TaxID=4795 RepID=A0A225V012_9STRA|nr:hypothetical protein PHMEG_00030708 [Phytophthora megakarya]